MELMNLYQKKIVDKIKVGLGFFLPFLLRSDNPISTNDNMKKNFMTLEVFPVPKIFIK